MISLPNEVRATIIMSQLTLWVAGGEEQDRGEGRERGRDGGGGGRMREGERSKWGRRGHPVTRVVGSPTHCTH